MKRRSFLKTAAALPFLPALFRGDPDRPLPRWLALAPPIRVRGRVTSGGRGLGGVAVSDGRTVVATDRDGRDQLVNDAARRDELAIYDDDEAVAAGLGIPFVQVVGNHDLDPGARPREASVASMRRSGPAPDRSRSRRSIPTDAASEPRSAE